MTTITAYHAMLDGSFTLEPGQSGPPPGAQREALRFNPSNDIKQGADLDRPLLCYRVDPSRDAKNLRLNVRMGNLRPLGTVTFSGDTSRNYMEIVHGRISEGDNPITFELEDNDGRGSLKISDVIVFYKRNI